MDTIDNKAAGFIAKHWLKLLVAVVAIVAVGYWMTPSKEQKEVAARKADMVRRNNDNLQAGEKTRQALIAGIAEEQKALEAAQKAGDALQIKIHTSHIQIHKEYLEKQRDGLNAMIAGEEKALEEAQKAGNAAQAKFYKDNIQNDRKSLAEWQEALDKAFPAK